MLGMVCAMGAAANNAAAAAATAPAAAAAPAQVVVVIHPAPGTGGVAAAATATANAGAVQAASTQPIALSAQPDGASGTGLAGTGGDFPWQQVSSTAG